MRAFLGVGELMVCAAVLLWLAAVWLAPRKAHRLCGGHGCRMCGMTGKRFRSRLGGWLWKRGRR
jgi:hypothetical protein